MRGELQGRAAGGVLLEAVVPLDNLHVEVLAGQELGCLPHHGEQHVDRQAHVRREQHGRHVGGRLDLLPLLGRKAGRGDDDGDAPLDAQRQDVERRLGHREVDEHVEVLLQGQPRSDRHAEGADAAHLPGVAVEVRRIHRLQCRGEGERVVLGQEVDQALAHAARPSGPLMPIRVFIDKRPHRVSC